MTTPAPNMDQYFFRASAEDFKKIPGSPIAYWMSHRIGEIFAEFQPLASLAMPRQGLATGYNDRFLRYWFEVSDISIGRDKTSRSEAETSGEKWFPCQKGGPFRKWYGNHLFIVNWESDGVEIRNFFDVNGRLRSRPQNMDFYFREGMTWSTISSNALSMRYNPVGFISETKGAVCFAHDHESLFKFLAFSNTHLVNHFLSALSPTLDYHEGPVGRLPVTTDLPAHLVKATARLVKQAKNDWDSYETSWDFTELPLLKAEHRGDTLEQTYANLRAYWREQTLEMQRLEEENNRIFIEAYGLEDELTPDVPLREITLTCNPSYRYSQSEEKTEKELEDMLRADTVREFVSYAVGCMFGRYSLDKPGLILANQGEGIADYQAQVPESRFAPEEHGVIPILDENWFTNDIVERFHAFLRTTFGEQHFEENLAFVEESLNDKGRKKWNMREYFVKDFYKDHVRTYKKRPIYWMFSSPKGSFNALIYLHRYRPDTVSVVLNEYLREYAAKLRIQKAELEALSIREDLPPKDRADAEKGIDKLRTILSELEDYERDVLHPLAGEQLEIDLDDGVKANYPKFKTALKKIF